MFNKRAGETFEFEGRSFKVCKNGKAYCEDSNGNLCQFMYKNCDMLKHKRLIPCCDKVTREDGISVCFIKEGESKNMILTNLDNGKGIKIIKHGLSKCYSIVGEKTGLTYGVFEPITSDLEVEHKDAVLLKELGFELIEPRKSWLEMYDECEEAPFVVDDLNWFVRKDREGRVSSNYYGGLLLPNFKYISKEDAERIVKECIENHE